MFIGVTIICIAVGYVVPRAEGQRHAIAALEAVGEVRDYVSKYYYITVGQPIDCHGVTILYDYEWNVDDDDPIESFFNNRHPLPGPKALRELIGVDYFANVVYVDARQSRIRDDELRHLRHFKKLVSLYLSGCVNITNVGLKRLTGLGLLVELRFSDNECTTLPPEIGRLTKLKSLHLDYNNFTTLPPEIGQLTNLEVLLLNGNKLTSLPSEIRQVVNLKSLNLERNQLASLPSEIGQLANLKKLGLGHNQLSAIPAGIGNLTKLRELILVKNHLTKIVPEIGQLTNLERLDLNDNKLIAIPATIGQLARLGYLNLDDNKLVTLPPEIGQLTNLERLGLGGNKLTTLPPEVGQLTSLTFLGLSHNPITDADLEHLKSLTNLKTIRLSNTKVTKEGIANLQRALPNCKIEDYGNRE